MTIDPMLIEEAVTWHVRQRDLTEDGWEAFVAWLEASPAHAGAYDAVASDDALLAGALAAVSAPTAVPASVPMVASRPARPRALAPTHRRWGRFAGAAAVAATLAVVVAPFAMRGGARPYEVETRAGEHRTLALADGTQVQLDGATRLRLDSADPRVAELEQGQVLLRVRHDDAHPFTLRSGAVAIRDTGTVFDVARSGARLDVAVAEGSVLFRPDADAVALKAGQRLALDERRGGVTLGSVAPADVGGWREDRLGFTGEPIAGVAAALERRYGTRIRLPAGLSDRPFTGMIGLSGSAERDIPHLAALIGADWRRERGDWVLAPQGARTP